MPGQDPDHRAGRPQGGVLPGAPADLCPRHQAGAQAGARWGVRGCAEGGVHQGQEQPQEGEETSGEEVVLLTHSRVGASVD